MGLEIEIETEIEIEIGKLNRRCELKREMQTQESQNIKFEILRRKRSFGLKR